MGRTYRNKDKRFKKQLKEGRNVRKNKRHIGIDECTPRKDEERKKENRMESYLLT